MLVDWITGSTMLNLSLLTSDMWAVLIRDFAYHEKEIKSIKGHKFSQGDLLVHLTIRYV
ncbi:hypothetical protein ACS0TY_027335 [Phlomoides rotata]